MKFVRFSYTTLAALVIFSQSALAEGWFEQQHRETADKIDNVALKMNDWIGENDAEKPANASVRVMLDHQWNRYDGYSVKPRVRVKIKLPALKQRFSIVMGDEEIDNNASNKTHHLPNYVSAENEKTVYDRQQVRNDNASLALRWSNLKRPFGIDTDFDVGLRSGGDVFGRFKINKAWQLSDQFTTRLEQIYRYGSNSKHYARTNFENKYQRVEHRFIANLTYLEYFHDIDESLHWGNSVYQQHQFANHKTLNYGVFAGGKVRHKKPKLNGYGPFITWRQPIWKEWVFLQAELNYYNDKDKARSHYLGSFLRLEAVF